MGEIIIRKYQETLTTRTPCQEPGYSLIPLTAIKSRVIHKKMLVNFGRIIGEHSVVVAVPLENKSLF